MLPVYVVRVDPVIDVCQKSPAQSFDEIYRHQGLAKPILKVNVVGAPRCGREPDQEWTSREPGANIPQHRRVHLRTDVMALIDKDDVEVLELTTRLYVLIEGCQARKCETR